MTDFLRMDYINSLPQPLIARFCGGKEWWPIYDIGCDVPWVRIDVCGLLERREFSEVMEIKDGEGHLHDPETFWTDFEEDRT